MDFSPYKALLNRLIPLSYQQDTETLLAGLLPDADAQTRYQLAAEINRLKAPCLRVLDLQQLFPEQCRQVFHRGLNHMLPPKLEQRFMQLLGQYNGDYTRGLYETLLADLAAMRKQPALFNATPWHQPGFGTRRKEPRVQFVTPAELHLEDGHIQVNTLDISVSGIMLTVPPGLILPQKVSVSFPALAELPEFACLAEPKCFQLTQLPVSAKEQEKTQRQERAALQRIEPDSAWQEALSLFIEQNRARYGQNAEDLYSTALAQCWGQTLLESGLGQSLFFDERGELQEILCNRFGKKLLEYWRHEQAGDLLPVLLPPERILAMAARQHEPVFLYGFKLKGKKDSYYFAAEQSQLLQKQLLQQFICEGQRAGTLQLYHLSIRPVLFTDQITENLDLLGKDRLSPLKWQLWLTPLPAPEPRTLLPANGRLLLPWLLTSPAKQITPVLLRQSPARKETRFRFETPVELLLNDKPLHGASEDISVAGMKLMLPQPVELTLPATVHISLPELNKLSPDWNLKKLPYRVVNISQGGKVMHLHAIQGAKGHGGSRFFSALLNQNQDKLRARAEGTQQPAWMRWLIRQALQRLSGPAFLLGRNDGGFYVQGSLASPVRQRLMTMLTDEKGLAQLGLLITRQLLQSMASALQRPDGKSHLVTELWITEKAEQPSHLQVNPATEQQQQMMAGKDRVTVCLAVVNRLQLRQLTLNVPEWNQLAEVSLYKTQLLEQNLAELALQCQIFNITDLARARVQLNGPAAAPAPPQD
ncbi:PilZ domain-containing protein [Oceanimonas smirnovii]|uniref:PilZ domain-containing protein n=1 Tax=Oceanimonas smirnovii TaxID=264574 RepID=UPI00376F8F63